MYKKCPTCLTELSDDDPAFDMEAIESYIEGCGGWSAFETEGFIPKEFPLGNSKVATVVEKKVHYDSGDVDVEGYFGESALPQGSIFTTYVVFKVGDVFFKKTGTGDSYGNVTWNGKFSRATVKVVERYVFE